MAKRLSFVVVALFAARVIVDAERVREESTIGVPGSVYTWARLPHTYNVCDDRQRAGNAWSQDQSAFM